MEEQISGATFTGPRLGSLLYSTRSIGSVLIGLAVCMGLAPLFGMGPTTGMTFLDTHSPDTEAIWFLPNHTAPITKDFSN